MEKTPEQLRDLQAAFLAGRICGEDALGIGFSSLQQGEEKDLPRLSERDSMQLFGERAEQLGQVTEQDQEMLTEFSNGYEFTMKHFRKENFRLVPEVGRIRAMKLLSGEPQFETTQAQLTVKPQTEGRILSYMDHSGLDLDTFLILAVDLFSLGFETVTGERLSEDEYTMTDWTSRMVAALKAIEL